MLAIERKGKILEQLSLEGKVVVSDLAKFFDVTEETIRRDLEKLDKEGLARKTYGGAVKLENVNIDLPFNVRKQANAQKKDAIAQLIAGNINEGDCIAIDASSTANLVIKKILHLKKLTILTNSIEILIDLCNKTDWNVISTGGNLKHGGLSLLGPKAISTVQNFNSDIAICSCKGLDIHSGITDSNEADAEIKKAFYKSAKRKFLACDSTKFGISAFVKVCNIFDIDAIFTDVNPGVEWLSKAESNNIDIIYQ